MINTVTVAVHYTRWPLSYRLHSRPLVCGIFPATKHKRYSVGDMKSAAPSASENNATFEFILSYTCSMVKREMLLPVKYHILSCQI